MSDFEMSLYYFLTHNFTLNPDFYDCPESLKVEHHTKRTILGSYFLVSGILLILIYLPCLIVMLKSKCRAPSFQLMILLALFDISSLLVNSVITGIMGILGASYCTFPVFIFFAGAIGLGSWMGSCVVCILLAVDRCVEINQHFPLAFLFHKCVFRVVISFVVIFWIYNSGFTKPLLFNIVYMSWFFDPQVGKDPSLYHNIPHTINNLLVSVISTPLYIYLCYQLIFKFGYSTSMWLYRSKRQIIVQAVIMCFFHASAAYIYVYMQFFPFPSWLSIIGQLAWQWSNGSVCLAYWTLNRTIRNSAIRLMLSKKTREKFGLHMGIDEMIEAERQAEENNRVAMETAKIAPFLA